MITQIVTNAAWRVPSVRAASTRPGDFMNENPLSGSRLKSRARGRRTGVCLGALVLAGSAGAGLANAAPPTPTPKSGPVEQDFIDAAAEFHVPLPVLMATGYESSWWESHGGQPSSHGSYGVMGLTDLPAGGDPGGVPPADRPSGKNGPAVDSLDVAATLAGVSPDQARTDDRQNIRAGAALLASYQRALTGALDTDPGRWYAAVARYSESDQLSGARQFADDAFTAIRDGAERTRSDGQLVRLGPDPAVAADTDGLRRLGLQPDVSGRPAECPAGLDCRFLPAAEGNFQHASRPDNGITVNRIVIHDTEETYDKTIAIFQNPKSKVSSHYVIRSSDGQITQLVPTKDVAYHAGDYWFNMHAIGIEHEGYAAQGATWYTPAEYRASATLVRYLAARFHVPLDREHIVGHDNVPGPTARATAGQHWDPGPYWDWNRYMALVRGGTLDVPHAVPRVGSIVTIAPDFAHNPQTVTVCDSSKPPVCHKQTEPSSFLFVRTGPSSRAPLFPDPAVHPGAASGTDMIDDWSDHVAAGQQFVVADRHRDWTAIWYAGRKAWFFNPDGRNTAPGGHGSRIVHPKPGLGPIPVYGTGYPEPGEYPPGFKPSAQAPLGVYTIPPGQGYVATAPPEVASDLFSTPERRAVFGGKRYVEVQLNHRVVLVDAADVDAG